MSRISRYLMLFRILICVGGILVLNILKRNIILKQLENTAISNRGILVQNRI